MNWIVFDVTSRFFRTEYKVVFFTFLKLGFNIISNVLFYHRKYD